MRKVVSLGLLLSLGTQIAFSSQIKAEPAKAPIQTDALQNIRFSTKSKFILMPVFDKTGSTSQYGSAGGNVTLTNEFATEVLNDAIREAGATTISWFKVNAAMNKKFGQEGINRADLTNDMFIPELISIGKTMGVKYIVRPALLNISSSSSTETSVNPAAFVPVFGMFAGATKTKTKKDATVTLKIDIISVAQDDIIGTARFEGAVRQQKESGAFGTYSFDTSAYTGGGMSADTKAAMFDAIDKAVDFIASKVN
jgi:curli biogenesis system outer membrane secretion channel CsgG